jgi:hypothetical protein
MNMSRITIRLPDSLHSALTKQSVREGLSLNQYVIYALARQTTFQDVVSHLPPEEMARQHARYQKQLAALGPPANDKQVSAFLSARGSGEPRVGVSADTRAKLREALARRRS